MIKIELRQADGSTKTYVQTFVSARRFREAIEMQSLFSEMNAEVLDKVVAFIVDVFDGQFTLDEVYDGIASWDMTDEIKRIISSITSKIPSDGTEDPN